MNAHASTPRIAWRITDQLVPYEHALAQMQDAVRTVQAGGGELVWLLQHPPLYTAGSSAHDADLRDAARFPVHRVGRGGQWTYHGPGQRVAYVILDLAQPHGSVRARDLHCYVDGLERWIIRALADLGVRALQRRGRVGVWVKHDGGEAKIAAVGVRVTRWVSWHGVALNVAPDLSHFSGIVPCGINEHGVTSLVDLGVPATMDETDEALRVGFRRVFGDTVTGAPPVKPAQGDA